MSLGMIRLDLLRLRRRPGRLLAAFLLLAAAKGGVLLALLSGAFGRIDNGFAYVSLSASHTLYLLSLLVLLASAGSLSGECTQGILRMQLGRPISRSAYFLQRSIFLVLLAILLGLCDALLGTAAGWIAFGFRDAADVALQGPQFSAGSLGRATAQAYLLTGVAMAALAGVGASLSVILRSPQGAMGFAAGLFFFFEGIRVLFPPSVARLSLTRYAVLPMDRLSSLARGIADYQAPEFWMQSLAIPCAYLILASLIGLLRFRRMDVLS
jgi:ABC-type transport system involved in multi-copper enzyme maturation permease subunit